MSRKATIAALLKRYQFVDLSIAVGMSPSHREQHLRQYVDRRAGYFSTYEPFRKAVGAVYGVSLGLDTSPVLGWPEISAGIRRSCRGRDEDMNLEAAKALYDLVREDIIQAYPHPEQSLPIGPDRKVGFRLGHYLVRDDRAIFQFPYPRRSRLSEQQLATMLSLIKRTYAQGDFGGADVEIADLSAEDAFEYCDGARIKAARSPRIVSLTDSAEIPDDELISGIQDVYDILMRLADE